MENVLFHKKLLIGKSSQIGEGDIKIELKIKEECQEKQTIYHEIINNYITLSLSGEIWQTNRRDITTGGQIKDELRNLNLYKELYINELDLYRIIEIWDQYHLNDLKPNCIHQQTFNCNEGNFTEQAQEQTENCPLNYKYGSSWLVEIIPSEIIEEIIYIFNKY